MGDLVDVPAEVIVKPLVKAVDKFGAVLVISKGYELTAVFPMVT